MGKKNHERDKLVPDWDNQEGEGKSRKKSSLCKNDRSVNKMKKK